MPTMGRFFWGKENSNIEIGDVLETEKTRDVIQQEQRTWIHPKNSTYPTLWLLHSGDSGDNDNRL